MNNRLFSVEENSKTKVPWILLLIQAIIKHWLSLIFVVLIFIVFRMPHLSDLTVVIIQKEYHFVYIPLFYVAIIVMAILISYSYLVIDKAVAKREAKLQYKKAQDMLSDTNQPMAQPSAGNSDEHTIVDSTHTVVEDTNQSQKSRLETMRSSLSLQDSKEREILAKKPPVPVDESKYDASPSEVNKEGLSQPKSNKNSGSDDVTETPFAYMNRVFPKFLATFMILSIAFAVNDTIAELFGQPFVPSVVLWIILAVFLLLTHQDAANYIKKQLRWDSKSYWIPMTFIILSTLIIVALAFFNQKGTSRDVNSLFVSMFFLALLFFTLNVSYNTRILRIKKKYLEPVVIFFFILALVLYLVVAISPSSTLNTVTPMVILMLCLVGIYVIFLVFQYLGAKSGWPILTLVFSGAIFLTILFAKNSKFKHYEVTNTKTENAAADRMDLDTYVDLWFKERAEKIAASPGKFPIIMVSAEGGGSRAGHWAFLVHSYLYEQDEAYFKDYLFSMTGASGGSVGSNIFYTQAYEHRNDYQKTRFRTKTSEDLRYKASEFYNNDFISSSIAGLLGRDLFASITNFSWFKDRGALTELEWEAAYDSIFNPSILGRSYLDIMPKQDAYFVPPIMVTTTTHVQSGAQYIMSPVKFEPNVANEMQFKDLLKEYQDKYPDTTMIKRSTAMLLTARFPYLSPNGRVTGIGQFGDGGYYDNVGGLVTRRLEQAILKKLNAVDSLKAKCDIRHLIIWNSRSNDFDECSDLVCKCKPKVDYNSQLLTPALMVINATFAPADEFVESYPKDFLVESKRTPIPIDGAKASDTSCDNMYRPLIPLGRYMSKASVLSLEARLQSDEVKTKLDNLLKQE
ncbi:hypothetical protein [uncultured Winogradskyella sp.]|uniref:hypothetical protein n=1 Tax=uncultured Winogradskyella sp. TaxID=395353 RepID=UPI002619B06C|nr:hypothetical protein [uncultured Winogradskyella sp.]